MSSAYAGIAPARARTGQTRFDQPASQSIHLHLTIVFHGERDEDIVGVEDIEEIYPSPIRNDSIKFAVRLTDDDKYDPNQVHMVTGNELLDYLTRKGKKNNE